MELFPELPNGDSSNAVQPAGAARLDSAEKVPPTHSAAVGMNNAAAATTVDQRVWRSIRSTRSFATAVFCFSPSGNSCCSCAGRVTPPPRKHRRRHQRRIKCTMRAVTERAPSAGVPPPPPPHSPLFFQELQLGAWATPASSGPEFGPTGACEL